MPLASGSGPKVHSDNVAEMIRTFKATGRIGASKPGSMKKALAQANAAAYRKGRQGRRASRTMAHGR